MKLSFLGAAGEVTGSCFLVDTGAVKFLVDCGMFQGGEGAERKNRHFAFNPKDIAFVLLTHAHIDHSGLLPRLVAQGFAGRGLRDARHRRSSLRDAARQRAPAGARSRARGGDAALHRRPGAGLPRARCARRNTGPPSSRTRACAACYRDAGHILGSAIIEVFLNDRKLVFSGDLGQPGRPIVDDPAPIEEADVLLVESTYGNRNHKSLVQTLDELAYALNDTLASKRGNVVIPSFAVGRTQELLYYIAELRKQGRIPLADVYVDSPMATAATRITLRYAKLPDIERVCFTESLEESMRINSVRSGAIIISASGMCEGGRIRHHLRYNIARPECAIVFVGFQAAGTLGRRIVDGAKIVRLFRETYPVRAKLFTINGLSAHADRDALLGWIGALPRPPRQTWVVHGEPLAADALKNGIIDGFGWRAEVPSHGQQAEL